jgi:hypothetical protein
MMGEGAYGCVWSESNPILAYFDSQGDFRLYLNLSPNVSIKAEKTRVMKNLTKGMNFITFNPESAFTVKFFFSEIQCKTIDFEDYIFKLVYFLLYLTLFTVHRPKSIVIRLSRIFLLDYLFIFKSI